MLTLLIIICAVILFFAVFEDYIEEKYKWFSFILIAICLMMYAGLRPVGFDRDSHNYETAFMHPDSSLSDISYEPFFLVICRSLSAVSSEVTVLFMFFALLGVSLKLYSVKRLTPLFFLPLLIYFSNFFILHETTQIRAGIASGLFLFAIKPLSEGAKMRTFVIILIASLFHYSALSLLPLLFLNNKGISTIGKIIYACLVPLCFLLYVLDLDLLTAIPIPFVTDKVEGYKMASEFGNVNKESILNPFPLMKMAVFLYFLYFSETIKEYVPSINLIIKILGCSLLVYFAFSSVKIISTRISELYGVVEIVAYPCIVFTIRPKVVGTLLVCIMAFIELYFNLVQWEILDFKV